MINMNTSIRKNPGNLLIILSMLFLLSLAYECVISNPYLFHDDYISIHWHRLKFWSHGYAVGNVQQGRWGAFILNPIASFLLTFETSQYVRFLSVIVLSLISFLNFQFLTNLSYPKTESFFCAVILATIPPFQSMVYGILSGQYILFSVLAAQLSFIFLLQKRYYYAAFFLLASQFTYVAAGYFLTFLVFYLFSPALRIDKDLIKRGWIFCAAYIGSMIVFYAVTLLSLKILHLPENHSTPGRTLSINHDVFGQIYFYLSNVVIKTANLWHIESTLNLYTPLSLTLFTSVIVLAFIGAVSLAWQKSSRVSPVNGLLFALLLLIIIPLTVAPMLAPIPGNWVPYRTLAPHMAIFFMLSFWGGVYIFKTFFSNSILKVAEVVLLISSMFYCNHLLNKYMIIPNQAERSYVEKALNSITPESKNINIAIRRDEIRSSFYPALIEDGWGYASTHNGWGMPLVVSILRSKGIAMQNLKLRDNVSTWPNGKITNLTSDNDEIPKNALLIDMRQMPGMTW